MPTGYTANIKNQTFKEFAFGCARAFGALVTMRDEPLSAPIPKCFDVSDYHKDKLEQAKKNLEFYQNLSDKECEAQAKEYYEAERERLKDRVKERKELYDKYTEMIELAKGYNPPSKNFEEYKKFMLQQLYDSRDWDCGIDEIYAGELDPLGCNLNKIQTGREWREDNINKALCEVEYHSKEWREENERVKGRNKWLKDLWASLEKYES